jgi:hypothetical protein
VPLQLESRIAALTVERLALAKRLRVVSDERDALVSTVRSLRTSAAVLGGDTFGNSVPALGRAISALSRLLPYDSHSDGGHSDRGGSPVPVPPVATPTPTSPSSTSAAVGGVAALVTPTDLGAAATQSASCGGTESESAAVPPDTVPAAPPRALDAGGGGGEGPVPLHMALFMKGVVSPARRASVDDDAASQSVVTPALGSTVEYWIAAEHRLRVLHGEVLCCVAELVC